MIKFTLFIVRLFRRLIVLLGADYQQLEILLRNKLTLDFRGEASSGFNSSKNKNQTFGKQLFIYSLLGVFIGTTLFSISDLLLNLTIIYAVIMVMLATNLINEFTSVLFDERENDILLPRPINNRTLLLFRLMHVQFYVGYIALALSLFAGIVLAVKQSVLISLMYFIGVGLSAWMTLLFTIFFYLALSKVVKGEKFKDFITYVQIALAIVIFGGYQLLPRIMDMEKTGQPIMSIHWWTYLIPPAWLAGFVKSFSFDAVHTEMFLLLVLAVVVPLVGAIVVVRFLSKGFGDILGQDVIEKSTEAEKISVKEKLSERMGRLFCVSKTESVGWRLAMQITRRDRKFKQSVYPLFGFIPVFAIVMLKPDWNDLLGSLEKMGDTKRYLFFIFLGFFTTSSITQLPFTDKPEAAWIYKALPFTKQGHILVGAVKAMLYKFFLPVYAFLILGAVLIWGIPVFPKMLLGGLLTVFMAQLLIVIQKMDMPFTQPRQMQQKGGNVLKVFLGMFFMGIVVGLVYLSSFLLNWIILLLSLVALGMIVLMNRFIRVRKF